MPRKGDKFTSGLFILLFIVVLFILFGQYSMNQQQKSITTSLNTTEHFIKKSINFLTEEEKDKYVKKSKAIFSNNKILEALERENREEFYNLIEVDFKRMKNVDNKFWGLHIILPNNMSFIRVHKPNTIDTIIAKGKKPLIDKVNEIKKVITNYDSGKFGYFLRVVTPIFSKQQKYLGLAEFSISADNITNFIKDKLHYDNRFLVKDIKNKKFLNHLSKTKNGLVIFKSSNKKLFNQNNLIVKSYYIFGNSTLFNNLIHFNNKVYKISKIILSDTANLEIAFDVTGIYNEHILFERNLMLFISLLILFSIVIWCISIMLNNKSNKLLKLNKEIQIQKKTFETLFNDASEGLSILRDGKFIDCNKAVLNMLRIENKKDLLNIHPSQLSPEFQPNGQLSFNRLNEMIQIAIVTGSNNFEWLHKRANGEEFYADITLTAMVLNNENVIHVVWKDISEKKKLQEDLKQKEMLIFEQSKMASMGAMIGNIAHQWKQPLSVISLITTGIQFKKELGILDIETLPEEMEIITNQIAHLTNTLNTFRNFLKEKKEFKEVILQDRIDVALNISGLILKDSGIELKNNINYLNPIIISLIIGELTEVLINIINNARDILIEKKIKEPWVQLDLIQEDNKAIISIEDNGGGIPSDVMPKLFDKYFTTKNDDKGTGLGLHMSYQIITKSLNGKIYAKNTENGAKFFIELPLK